MTTFNLTITRSGKHGQFYRMRTQHGGGNDSRTIGALVKKIRDLNRPYRGMASKVGTVTCEDAELANELRATGIVVSA